MTIQFPRSAPSVPKVEESSDPSHQFLISEGLLILAIEMLGQSRLLIAKGFNQTAREFSHLPLYKGLI